METLQTAPAPSTKKTFFERFDKKTVYWVAFIHAGCLLAPFTFTWPAFWVFVALYVITGGLGVSLCFHRLLSHRSFKTPKPVEYALTIFGCLSAQRSPIYWVARHRVHHAKTDKPGDPHSPVDGFWWSHFIWFMKDLRVEDENEFYKKNAADLANDPGHRFIQKTHEIWPVAVAALLFLTGGLPFLVWGFFVRTAAVYHGTWLVNSAGHTWGYQNYDTGDDSKNNFWIALVSFGDGWHNNHHACQSAARAGQKWWEFDPSYGFLLVLKSLGLARDIRPVKKTTLRPPVQAAEPVAT